MKPAASNNTIRMWHVELPQLDSLDAYLQFILPKIDFANDKPIDVEQPVFASGAKRWHEIQATDTQDSILRIFEPDGSYILSHEGNVTLGHWRMVNSNTLTIQLDKLPQHELFDIVFVSNHYFILKKHGSHQQTFLFLGIEGIAKNKTCLENLEALYAIRNQNLMTMSIIVICVIILLLACWILFF